MTPNFALDLSEDGIVLLHRSPTGGGWFREGRVDFASDDIAEGLAVLRAKAVELEGEDFQTKLILPSSQLLFTTVSAGADIGQALSERTPYRADQLSYVTSGSGDKIKVVAVALETLGEAEGFIAPHGLNPVGFTAIPDPSQFDGEPMLGGTLMGADGFDPDPMPVNIIEKPTFLPDPVAPMDNDEDTAEVASPEPEADTSVASQTVIAEAPDPIKPDVADMPDVAATPETSSQEDVPEAPEEPVAPAAFSSRRQASDDSGTDQTGSRVTKRTARIGVPEPIQNGAPKLGAAPAKTAPAAPKVKSVAPPVKQAPKPVPVVPPAPSAKLQVKPAATATADLANNDPIAKLAAQDRRGKPRFLGLILTFILLACLGLAAILSSFVLPDNAVSKFFEGGFSEVETVNNITEPALIEGVEADVSLAEEIDLASLPMDQTLPDLSGDDDLAIVPEDTPLTVPAPERVQQSITEAEAETAYAATGIWQHAHTLRLGNAAAETLDDLYVASLDPNPAFEDAPALIDQSVGGGEVELIAFTPPPPPGVIFDIDERGLVRPTPEGSLSPEGAMVFQGKPPILPGRRPATEAPQAVEVEPETEPAVDARLAGIRPTQRPENLVETQERATLGGRSRPELAGIRPVQRPASAQARAEAIARALAEAEAATQAEAEAALVAATRQAVSVSRRAQLRPANFARVVARARATPQRTPQTVPSDNTAPVQTASASTASPSRGSGPAVARGSRAQPTGRVSATVARAATDNNALALGKVALVGVFGTSSNRRALVRMPNGRFKKVAIGDRVDGGRVAGIDGNSLRYTKGGRSVLLKMPKG